MNAIKLQPEESEIPLYKDRLFWLIVLCSLVCLSPLLVEAVSFDNAIFHVIGLDIIRYHRLPYVETIDHAFPGMMFFQAAQAWLIGASDIGQRLIDIVIQTAFSVLLYRVSARWMDRRVAALAGILYPLIYLGLNGNVYGEGDVYVGILTCCTFAVLTSSKSTYSRIALAGLLTGVSILFRPTSLLFSAIFALYFIVASEFRTRRLTSVTIFATLAALPLGMFLIYYFEVPHGLARFYDLAFGFNLQIYSKLASPTSAVSELVRLTPLTLAWLVGCVCFASVIRRNPAGSTRYLYFSLVAAAFVIVVVQGKFFRYHFMPFFALQVPLASAGLWSVSKLFQSRLTRAYGLIALVIVVSIIRYQPIAPLSFALATLQHHDAYAASYASKYGDPQFGAPAERQVIQYFEQPDRLQSTVEVLSTDPLLRLHLNHPTVTGFVSVHTLGAVLHHNADGTPEFAPYQMKLQQQLVSELSDRHPEYIVVARHIRFWAVNDLDRDCLRYIPGFNSLLSTCYRRDTVIGGYEIYGLAQNRQ